MLCSIGKVVSGAHGQVNRGMEAAHWARAEALGADAEASRTPSGRPSNG